MPRAVRLEIILERDETSGDSGKSIARNSSSALVLKDVSWKDRRQEGFGRRIVRYATDFLATCSLPCVIVLGFLGIAIVGELDILMGPDLVVSVFSILPLGYVTWRAGRTSGFIMCFVAAFTLLAVDLQTGRAFSSAGVLLANAGLRLALFLLVAQTLSKLSTSLELARTDHLTGLANRRGLYYLAEREIYRSIQSGRGFTLAYIDIDDFKAVNDNFGHEAGDNLLKLIGSTLQKSTRRSDIVARLGGDEFAIILPDAGYASAAAAMSKIHESLKNELVRHPCRVTISVGLATFDGVPESVQQAIERADSLMYEAKRKGKNITNHRRIQGIIMARRRASDSMNS